MTKEKQRSGCFLAHPIRAVVFDLMNTIFQGRRKHRLNLAQIYRREFEVPINMGNLEILKVVDKWAALYAKHNKEWPPDLRIPSSQRRDRACSQPEEVRPPASTRRCADYLRNAGHDRLPVHGKRLGSAQ